MSKFGFDYYVKRMNLVTEMARETSLYKFVSKEFNELVDNLIKGQIKDGVKDASTRQIIIYRYIIDTINNYTKLYKDEEGDLMTSGEIAKELTNGTSHTHIKKTLMMILKANKELAGSSEVMNHLRDEGNLDSFKRYSGFKGDTSSSRRIGKENEYREVTNSGVNIQDIESQYAQIKPYLDDMNRVMGGRKKRNTPFNNEVSASEDAEYNPSIDFANGIIDAVDTLISSKKDWVDSLKSGEITMDEIPRNFRTHINSKTFDSDLSYIKKMYEESVNEGVGATPELFDEFINKLRNMKGMTPDRMFTFDSLQEELEELSKHTLIDLGDSDSDTVIIDGYDNDVVAKYLDTPEKLDKYKRWKHSEDLWRRAKNDKLEIKYINKIIDIQSRLNSKLSGMNHNEVLYNPAIQQYMGTIQALEKMREKQFEQTKIDAINKKIEEINDKIAEIRSNLTVKNTNREEDEENELMESFVQTLRSDFTKPRGKFVDRGVNESINYGMSKILDGDHLIY